MLIQSTAYRRQRILRREARDEAVVTRITQIHQAIGALQKRQTPATERNPLGVIDVDTRGQPMRPATITRAHAEVGLFAVAFREKLGVQEADVAQTVAPHVQTEADANRNLDTDSRMRRC